MTRINIRKGETLQRKGDLNTKVYVLETGLLRSYALDEKGKEHIFMFAPEGWIMADSQRADEPADLYIDALEDSVVTVREKLPELNNPNGPALIRRIHVLQKRVLMLMSASAIERYEHFVATYADITQRVSQKMIASYLGITPEALSKVKAERLKGG